MNFKEKRELEFQQKQLKNRISEVLNEDLLNSIETRFTRALGKPSNKGLSFSQPGETTGQSARRIGRILVYALTAFVIVASGSYVLAAWLAGKFEVTDYPVLYAGIAVTGIATFIKFFESAVIAFLEFWNEENFLDGALSYTLKTLIAALSFSITFFAVQKSGENVLSELKVNIFQTAPAAGLSRQYIVLQGDIPKPVDPISDEKLRFSVLFDTEGSDTLNDAERTRISKLSSALAACFNPENAEKNRLRISLRGHASSTPYATKNFPECPEQEQNLCLAKNRVQAVATLLLTTFREKSVSSSVIEIEEPSTNRLLSINDRYEGKYSPSRGDINRRVDIRILGFGDCERNINIETTDS